MRILKKTKINFVGHRKIAAIISSILIFIGLISLISKGGPELAIDFTGGTVVQLKFEEVVDIANCRTILAQNDFNNFEITTIGDDKEILIKTVFEGSNVELQEKLKTAFAPKIFDTRRVEVVGPKIGKELRSDALYAIVVALLLILIYIAFRFDFYYAIGSVAALIHDILITLGIFSLLGMEINLAIVAAFLTIVGYSLNDTIVVFDRIRENIKRHAKEKLEQIVNISLNETLSRTIVTSFTTLAVVVFLYFIGGEVIKLFAFALIVGVFVGTYSSLYVASPVMIYFENRAGRKIAKKK
ncbi:MAG: protein translocase subunit SecF [Candidatus Marinimicrobia bacterium]|nr:protein translocase subunit SecF [Candidatus Neomarinimicrobiota bacterium]MBL7023175.1 protein translocase subunit SecF [Candidatus Neomarinimicrobiota bacterium]MBL7109017.1 protein translocase subunit SecF [Candidatus Neomarinimicrobiota bacterium]